MQKIQRKKRLPGLLLLLVFCLCSVMGCASKDSLTVKPESGVHYYTASDSTQTEEAEEADDKLYLITSMNSAEESFTAYLFSNGLEYQFHYNLGTKFMDKYGTEVSTVNFEPGKVIHAGTIDPSGIVSQVQIADEVWEYDNITRFSVDLDKSMLTIADNRYICDPTTYVFSGDQVITPADITSDDTISVIGMDNRILSVIVTTGHGTLALTNTGLFDGSYLQLDKKVFAQITSNMSMDVPEGTYTLSVANNGWGGSQEITITRGETTTVDLDTLKGDGPKYGKILFTVNAENATVSVDGAQIDYTEPVDLQYGRHILVVKADGYEDWTRYLYVNSEEATILIELDAAGTGQSSKSGSGSSESTEKSTENSSESSSESSKINKPLDSETSSQSTEKSSESIEKDKEDLQDYLSTLSQMLNSLTD